MSQARLLIKITTTTVAIHHHLEYRMVTFWIGFNFHLSSVVVVLMLRVGSCLGLTLPKCLKRTF